MPEISTAELLEKYGLNAKKQFGQNFLTDKNILQKIVDTADIKPDETVVEIGPGLGALTKLLLQKSKKVIAYEKDTTLEQVLLDRFKDQHFELIFEDALKADFPTEEFRVVANIPYYLTSPLITRLLQMKNRPTSLVMMVQKEVADKICSPKSNILSLLARIYGSAKKHFNVSKNCFFPPPKIDSAILEIKVDTPKIEQHVELLEFIKKGFSNPRKTLLNSLKTGLARSSDDVLAMLQKAGINEKRRPEELSVDEWVQLFGIS